MAELLTAGPHDHSHALIGARLRRDLDRLPAPRPIRVRGDAGSGAVLLLVAAVPLIVLVVMAVSQIAGAVAGIAAAGGAS